MAPCNSYLHSLLMGGSRLFQFFQGGALLLHSALLNFLRLKLRKERVDGTVERRKLLVERNGQRTPVSPAWAL